MYHTIEEVIFAVRHSDHFEWIDKTNPEGEVFGARINGLLLQCSLNTAGEGWDISLHGGDRYGLKNRLSWRDEKEREIIGWIIPMFLADSSDPELFASILKNAREAYTADA